MDDNLFRWIALIVFVTAMSISAQRRRRARRAGEVIPRGSEQKGLIAGRLFVALPLFGAVTAYIINPALMVWSSLGLPTSVRWLGVVLGVLAVPAVHWVFTSLGANVSETVLTKQDHQLVTRGPYRWVRHPLYSVGIALFISMGLMADNWFILLWAAVALIGLRVAVIPREEAFLVAKFGDEYRRYRDGTGALLPKLSELFGQRGGG